MMVVLVRKRTDEKKKERCSGWSARLKKRMRRKGN
jgi:hypothetical protein